MDSSETQIQRPKEFSSLFDCIHLSNLPDYMHGHLSTFLYALPIMRRSFASNVRANCLRNSDSFPTVYDYLSEYQLITSDSMLTQLCDVMVFVEENTDLPYPMADYTVYTHSSPHPQHDFASLLPRK